MLDRRCGYLLGAALLLSLSVSAQDSGPDRPIKLERVDDPRARPPRKVAVPDGKRTLKEIPSVTEGTDPAETIPAPDDVGAIPEDAKRTADGVAYRVLEEGWGDRRPVANDLIAIHYNGWLQDGRLFDTTANRRDPKQVQVNQAGGGLGALFSSMVAGEKRRVWIPEEIADEFRSAELDGHVVFDLSLIQVDQARETPESVAMPPEAATTSISGLSSLQLRPGRGEATPGEDDMVLVHLDSWTREGVMKASTTRGVPAPRAFRAGKMVSGLREAILSMQVGERRRLWLPGHLTGPGPGTVGESLTVELELVTFIRDPAAAPPDVAGAPEDATRTSTGLAFKVMRPGTGDYRPIPGSTVILHYTAWSPTGQVVDTSHRIGKPIALTIDESLPRGMREALVTMVAGEQRRVWLPAELGFQGENRKSGGPLVFELDVVEVH